MGCNPHPMLGYGGVVMTGLGPPVVSSPLCLFQVFFLYLCIFSLHYSLSKMYAVWSVGN